MEWLGQAIARGYRNAKQHRIESAQDPSVSLSPVRPDNAERVLVDFPTRKLALMGPLVFWTWKWSDNVVAYEITALFDCTSSRRPSLPAPLV
jgi:hypothetical protein